MRNLILTLLTFLFIQINLVGQDVNTSVDKLLSTAADQTLTLLKNNKYRSARKRLVSLIQKDWEFSQDLIAENAALFNPLKNKKWQWRKVDKAFSKNAKGIDMPLRNKIISMETATATLLKAFQTASKEGGHNSQAAGKKWKEYVALGKNNLVQLDEVLSKNGFLGKDKIGKKGAAILYSMIQKSGDVNFLGKHISTFERAFAAGQMSAMQYATLVDKLEYKKGGPQVFGTFILQEEDGPGKEFHTIRDERNVNKRRAAIGLNSIEEFAKSKDFEYKFVGQKLKKNDFNKFIRRWELVNIRNAETNKMVFEPKEKRWIDFQRNSRLKYNLDINTCEIPFQASADGVLKLSKLSKCTKLGPDDPALKKLLNYNAITNFELYKGLLFLFDDNNQIWEFRRNADRRALDKKAIQKKSRDN